MKKLCVTLGLLFAASAASAHDHGQTSDTTVRWRDITGVIATSGNTNPVSNNIDSGTFAWTTTKGNASVDLASGATSFDVEGLVINGTMFSGTPGPVTAVTGTLVCNPGDPANERPLDTAVVPLDAVGNASFSGSIPSIPDNCANPLFLVRIANLSPGANGRWIATGAVRVVD